ncbi:MAG TPA: GtrA family protein [Alphaproteobacteria bacterium]|nr:GtrA family protein [Alphaproteobacteria bacterium]
MRRAAVIATRYAAFAGVATGVNIGTQWLALKAYGGPLSLLLAMAFGTGTGLAVKYVLDKRWIFADRSTGLAVHVRKFSLYTMMGIATTAVFWMTELLFNALSPGGRARFWGALLGLAIGYSAKYWLDRRFVFGRAP